MNVFLTMPNAWDQIEQLLPDNKQSSGTQQSNSVLKNGEISGM